MTNKPEAGQMMPELFKAFFATPKDELKDFSRPGGFKGMAISPYYMVKRLTASCGLCGIGWGIEHAAHEFVHVGDTGQIMVFVTMSIWFIDPITKQRGVVGPHAGGDTVALINKDGQLKVDDEAVKKAYTDAFSKCCSWIGLGGDVHDGMLDNKYVADKPWDVSSSASSHARKAVAMAMTAHDDKPGYDWSQEERDTCKTMLYGLCDTLASMGMDDSYIRKATDNLNNQIGDPDLMPDKWMDRFKNGADAITKAAEKHADTTVKEATSRLLAAISNSGADKPEEFTKAVRNDLAGKVDKKLGDCAKRMKLVELIDGYIKTLQQGA